MFILFGFGHRTVKRCGGTEKANCGRCSNIVHMDLVKVRTWFTLFFIPVIPYKTEYLIVCPVCRNATAMSKSEFETMLAGASSAHSEGGTLPAGSVGSAPGYNKYAGKTETQIAYLKQMEEIEREREQSSRP